MMTVYHILAWFIDQLDNYLPILALVFIGLAIWIAGYRLDCRLEEIELLLLKP